MNDWTELGTALCAMAASGSAEVREDGEWLSELAALHCELRQEGKNPLVHLWSDEPPRTAGRVTREQFRGRLRRMLAEQFPDATIESLTNSPDLEHSFSGAYAREACMRVLKLGQFWRSIQSRS